jgi:hypothetical protein
MENCRGEASGGGLEDNDDRSTPSKVKFAEVSAELDGPWDAADF